MKKLKSTLPNMILSLGSITILAGVLLGVTYSATKEPIARQAVIRQMSAIKEVAPPYDNNPEAEKAEVVISGTPFTVYPAKMNGKLVGAAVKGSSNNGFAGEITVMTGFDADGSIREYQVLRQAETPGLGAKMQEWFRDPAGARSVIGKNPAETPMYVTQDKDKHGKVDGITAATISSRAFLEIMRNAYEAYKNFQNND